MVRVFSAARRFNRAAGVCVIASMSMLAACSSDGGPARPPSEVISHAALLPEEESEPSDVEIVGPQIAQAYPMPADPSGALSEEEAQRTYVDPDGPEFEPPQPDRPRTTVLPPPSDFVAPRVPRIVEAMSQDELACRKQLKALKVSFVELSPIYDGPSCGIPHPVKVSAIGSMQIRPAATLNCEMAATFASWARRELASSARWRYLSSVKTIHQGSSYSCRRIRGSGKPSAHSQGRAIDIMAITLGNGKKIDVRKKGLFSFRERGLLNTVRADGCEYFTTVLGPGYDRDHRDHFHFDLMQRKRGRVACH